MSTNLWTTTQRRRLVGLCAAMTGEYAAAEDLAQETLLEAWRNRHKLHDASGADRWLAAIACNVCLRWQRRRRRELQAVPPVEPPDVEPPHDRSELEELVERSLRLLPPAVRDALVQHHVDGVPQAEIATRLGIAESAVSMRLSRGRRVLRRAVEAESGADGTGWEPTSVWCTSCGSGRLEIRRDRSTIAFRCPSCAPTPRSVFDLANPSFARLLGDVRRPTAILARAADWSSAYFRGGAGQVECTRCGGPSRLRRHDGERLGLVGRCDSCGEEVWNSVTGLALSTPEARSFAREHGKVRTLRPRSERHTGTQATVVRVQAVTSNARLEIAFDRDTLSRLAVR